VSGLPDIETVMDFLSANEVTSSLQKYLDVTLTISVIVIGIHTAAAVRAVASVSVYVSVVSYSDGNAAVLEGRRFGEFQTSHQILVPVPRSFVPPRSRAGTAPGPLSAHYLD
jgi:hypothetical protein